MSPCSVDVDGGTLSLVQTLILLETQSEYLIVAFEKITILKQSSVNVTGCRYRVKGWPGSVTSDEAFGRRATL